MENIIWTKEELQKIKPILKKFNLTLNDENTLGVFDKRIDEYSCPSFRHNEINDINTLLFNVNRNEIQKTLNLTVPLKYTVKKYPNNPLLYGFITNLSKIDPNDHTKIFTVLVEILSLYKGTASNYAGSLIKKINNLNLIKDKIDEIRNSDTVTQEEFQIKEQIDKKLKIATGIAESSIFKPMIEKYNNRIKDYLIQSLIKRSEALALQNIKRNNRGIDGYQIDFTQRQNDKFARRNK